eukprot:2206607-Alexandrium_andersonii.AAC.1
MRANAPSVLGLRPLVPPSRPTRKAHGAGYGVGDVRTCTRPPALMVGGRARTQIAAFASGRTRT